MQDNLTTYILRYKCVDKTTNRLRKMVNFDMCPYGNNEILMCKVAEAMYNITDNEIDTTINSYDEFCSKYTEFNVCFMKSGMYERYRTNNTDIDPSRVIKEEWNILPFKGQIFEIYKSFA